MCLLKNFTEKFAKFTPKKRLQGGENVNRYRYFASTLRNLRKEKGLSQSELAHQLYVSRSLICAYEKNLRMPSLDILIRLAIFFDCSVEFLLGIENKAISNDEHYLNISGLNKRQVEILSNLIEEFRQ